MSQSLARLLCDARKALSSLNSVSWLKGPHPLHQGHSRLNSVTEDTIAIHPKA